MTTYPDLVPTDESTRRARAIVAAIAAETAKLPRVDSDGKPIQEDK